MLRLRCNIWRHWLEAKDWTLRTDGLTECQSNGADVGANIQPNATRLGEAPNCIDDPRVEVTDDRPYKARGKMEMHRRGPISPDISTNR